jgi:hypothetical protein
MAWAAGAWAIIIDATNKIDIYKTLRVRVSA